jgi:gliding motility-associated-like protein
LCANGASSQWVGPFAFSTSSPGLTCASPIVVTTLPYSTTDNTGNYGDTTDVAQPAACAGTATNYMTGNDVFYSFTPTTTGAISVTMTPTGNWSGIFVYQGCANVGVNCVAGVANTGGGVRSIPSIPVVAGQEYIIVISTNAAPQTIGYTLVIQTVNCAMPTTLSASGISQTSANLSWANPGGATSWEVAVQTAGSPIPAGAGVQTNVNTNYPAAGLTVNTAYQYYVRADCGNGTFSAWAGPFLFNTLCAPFNVPFQEGFNSTSTTENCWTVLNVNGDTDLWNMNYATTPFEGNQCAAITTDFNNGANNDWLISPQIILTGNQRLKFHYRVQSTGEPNDFRVMLSTNGTSPADFTTTLLPLATYSNTTYVQSIVSLAGYTGPVNIAWHVPQGGLDGWRLFIDNVIIEDLPSCPEPTALTSSNVLSTSATVSWVNGNTETAWEVIALPCGSPAPTAASVGVNVTTSGTHTLTGLTPTTCYDVYVRAVCAANDISPWTGPTTFTTQVAPPVCGGPYVDAGGANANYPNSSDSTVTICPTPGNVVTVTFTSFNTETNWDALYVFDGNSINAPQIASTNPAGNVPGGLAGGFWGTTIPGPFTSSSTDGCLTFRFRSDTSVNNPGWVANVTCDPAPNCAKPTVLTATQITTTSALLGWTEASADVTQWEVIILPAGSPVPLPSATGTIVSTNGALFSGLNPGTQYTFYVRSICPTSGTSLWSNGFNFNTLLANDECNTAIFAPVNSSSVCQQVTPGSLAGATASGAPAIAPCIGTPDDDVWYQFIASNPFLTVSLQNIVGSTTNLNFAVYSGSCGTLAQLFCSAANTTSGVVNGLTIGQTYFVRVYSNANTPQTTTFNLCISTPASCISGQAACQNLSYQNTTGVANQGTIGCLGSSPNPAYYTINVATSGPINLLLTQSTTQGGTPNLDVDYAAWGPFTNQAAACAAIGNPPTLAPGIGVPVTLQTGCSFSAAPTENLNIANAVAGQVYVILITNFSNQPGFISLTQTNVGAQGAGVYDCCPDAFFTYTPASYCKSPGAPNPVPTINPGSLAGVFSLSPASPTGLVFANTATGEIDLAASAPGNYLVLNTVAATASCIERQRTYNISIVAPSSATISYGAPSYCKNINTPQAVTVNGTTGGTFSATPNGGLNINANTGAIDPSTSAPGVYNVTYSLPGSTVCANANPTTQVEILPLPNVVQPASVQACDSYTLTTLTVGNYFTQSQLGGSTTPIDITTPLTSSQTVYVYAIDGNGCYNEKSFNVTINSVPTPTFTATQSDCATATGTITVNSPTSQAGTTPTDLFISEVTDESTGSLTYIEIFNGTGAPKNLANYKLRIYTTVTGNPSCDLTLSGTLNNNATHVVAVGSNVNQGGVTPNQVFASCGGVNDNDNIRLTTSANALVDIWGRTDGVSFTPGNQAGYTYRRNTNAVAPSTTWNSADWTAIDPQDYTNVGSYVNFVNNYEYSIDGGTTYQSSSAFTAVAPGTHVLVVRDIATGCTSQPIDVFVAPTNPIPAVTTFDYGTGTFCQDAANPSPNTSATGFTTGGTFSEVNTTGLVIDSVTGQINLAASTVGSHTVRYEVAFNPVTCQSAGSTDVTIQIIQVINPIVGFTYSTASICQNAQPSTLTPTLDAGFSTFAQFSVTPSTGLSINTTTGVINLAASTAGIYQIVVDVTADAATCRVPATSATFTLEIKPVITPVVSFSYNTPVCASDSVNLQSPILGTGFTLGGVFSSSAGLSLNASTGVVTVDASTPSTSAYTVSYHIDADASTCQLVGDSQATITIIPEVAIEVTGGCEGVSYVLTASPVDGSFNPQTVTYSWQNSLGIEVGTTQSITVTELDTYTVIVNDNGCNSESAAFPVDAITCVVQKGISVNNDGLNDTFDLRGFNVKKLTIFNRNGMKVYSRANYTNQWGGQSDDGDDLPDGTYYFVIDRNNAETKTGWIYINRAQ